MIVRQANIFDANRMCDVLNEIFIAKKREKDGDINFVLKRYLQDKDRISCWVVEDENGRIIGFQSVKHATKSNPYDTPIGWGIIGTHIRPSSARKGIGRMLFSASKESAKKYGLNKIEAYISDDNLDALAYYNAIGFKDYRYPSGNICKFYDVG